MTTIEFLALSHGFSSEATATPFVQDKRSELTTFVLRLLALSTLFYCASLVLFATFSPTILLTTLVLARPKLLLLLLFFPLLLIIHDKRG